MLHRLTLRVLPSLSLAVTEDQVRKRKRLVMLVPGLVAFVIFRAVKQVDPLSDPFALLIVSGILSTGTAVWAYRLGRRATLASMWKEDGLNMMAWLVGWIGFAYGVQLSLLVLALLRVVVGYDFLQHPDGPAMMAIIIACTSVARDAFELGHVRMRQRQGHPVWTFPDGSALRAFMSARPRPLLAWCVLGAGLSALTAVGIAHIGEGGGNELVQFFTVSIVAATMALFAYLAGEKGAGRWPARLAAIGPRKLFQFWWWPGLAFAATYYLVLSGIMTFVVRMTVAGWIMCGLLAGVVGGLMSLYCYYLGHRRREENSVTRTVPDSLLRCPFILGMLSKTGASPPEQPVSPGELVAGESGRRG